MTWTAPYNGGEEIDQYDVELLNTTKQFVNDATCTGAIEDGLNCVFSHEYLIVTYGLKVGDILQVRVRAHNKFGWGAYSQVNVGSAFIMTVPQKMQTPIEGALTTYDRIQTKWSALSTFQQTGGTFSITSYEL